MKKAIFLSGFLLLWASSFLCKAEDQGVKPRKIIAQPARIFVLSIGVDYDTRYCASDAVRFSQLFSDTSDRYLIKKTGTDSVDNLYRIHYNRCLTGNDATFDRIAAEISVIIKEIRPEDAFVFYFAGTGFKMEDKASGREDVFGLYSDPLLTGDYLFKKTDSLGFDYLKSRHFSSLRLKNWLSLIQCRHQLVVSDVCHGRDFYEHFVTAAVDKDAAITGKINTNRVFVYVRPDLAYENVSLEGGFLTYLISSLPDSLHIFNCLDTRESHRIIGTIIQQESALAEKIWIQPGYTAFSYETDIIRILQLFGTSCSNDSRGLNLSPTPAATGASAPEVKNYALIIGTDIYDSPSWKKLNNPVLDATTISDELKKNYGFETELLINPSRIEILLALRKYSNISYDSLSQLFIFIAGHGGYDEMLSGYIACRDSRSPEEDPFRDTYLLHANLQNTINNLPCRHIMVVLDVCFGGTFDQNASTYASGRSEDRMYANVSIPDFIQRKMKHKTRLYITSGGKEYVPDGRPGRHSPFAARFIEALRNYGGDDKVLTYYEIKTYTEKCSPEPKAGDFGFNEPGSDFLFIAK